MPSNRIVTFLIFKGKVLLIPWVLGVMMVVEKSIMVESFGMAQYPGGGNSNIFGILTPKIEEDSHFDSYF